MTTRNTSPGDPPLDVPVNVEVLPDNSEAQGIVVRGGVTLTASAPATVTVGVTSASIVAANANRRGLIITNLSSNSVSIGLGTAAILNRGITLTQNGSWNMGSFDFVTDQINAIASASGSIISIQEFS